MRKQLEFTTEKGKFLLIDNPYETEESFAEALLQIKGFENITDITEIGKVKEITEEQWKDIVDSKKHSGLSKPENRHVLLYKDYPSGLFVHPATESGMSLLESLGVLLINPHKHPKEIFSSENKDNLFQKISMKKWQEAQEKVWVNPILFKVT